MRCPSCGEEAKKMALDRYWCGSCRMMWMIHELATHPEPKEEET